MAGLTATVTVDVYAPNDAACCPSGGARQQWRFDGAQFRLVVSTAIPPPGA